MIGQGGDGGTVDIGMGCLSGMFERNDDVLFVCYDNEGYMNTGVQRSGATPPAARTATTQAVGAEPGNVFGQGKSAPLIAMAHEIPYVATATVADLRDLEAKVEHAMSLHGARYLHVLVTCPLGWGCASRDTVRIARLASETGLFPVFEAEAGDVIDVTKIRRRVPVEEYLRPQKRFAHLFAPERRDRRDRQDPGPRRPQHRAIRAAVMDKPFAITLDVGSSLANKTGSWRTERPALRAPHAAVQRRLPRRRELPAVALPRRGRRLRGGLAADHGRQPAARRHGPGLLPPVRDRLQPRRSSTRRSGSTPSSASSATRRSGRAGASRSTAPPTGKRVLVVGAGPSGLSAAYHLRAARATP